MPAYDVDATIILRDSAGTELQDLSADGYGCGPAGEPDMTWRRDRITSPFVDGHSLIAAAKDGGILEFTVRVEGADWAEVTTRWLALRDWLDVWTYKVEVVADGVSTTYVAEPADITPEPLTGPTVRNLARQFSLSIPVQPNPAVTGLI